MAAILTTAPFVNEPRLLQAIDHLTIAHEAGHFMGLAPSVHDASGFMAVCLQPDRQRVSANNANLVNPV
jgi:hypothetical protein